MKQWTSSVWTVISEGWGAYQVNLQLLQLSSLEIFQVAVQKGGLR